MLCWSSREEIPHAQGKTNPSKMVGVAREHQSAMAQEQPTGATPRSRSREAAERRYPASEVRGGGREELPHAPMPEARGGGGGSNPTFKEPWLRGRRRA